MAILRRFKKFIKRNFVKIIITIASIVLILSSLAPLLYIFR